MNKNLALVLPALLVLALAGCGDDGSGGAGGSGGSGGAGSGGAGAGALSSDPAGNTACLAHGSWNLDVDDAATQLGTDLASKGVTVTTSTGEGHQKLTFGSDGHVSTDTGLDYTVVLDMGEGLVMTMVQNHAGAPGGEWKWVDDSNVVAFPSFETDYTVTTHIDINGTATESAMPMPSTGLGGVNMTIVSCDAGSMTTQATGSPFQQHWTNS